MNKIKTIKIFDVNISKIDNESFLRLINEGIAGKSKLCIAYANADSLNKIYDNNELRKAYSSFPVIHPDGIGVYLASKFLYGNKGLESRLTGSDFL
ncbi:MAG: hypothetical protein IPG09_07985 [Ignavibacteria bacterium]|nr:hypothetical protein [Ignavibacteria bacterium]